MPASYPSAIKTFTTLVDGVDDVLAAHQNDPNAEITAIETELGTNPRGTFADIKERIRFWGARVFHNANQSIPDSTDTGLAFNSERFDSDAFHDTVTNNGRLTVPKAGKYLITFSATLANGSSGTWSIYIRLNGVTPLAYRIFPQLSGLQIAETLSTIYDLAVNDYVEIRVVQSSGAAKDVLLAGNYSPEFSIALLST